MISDIISWYIMSSNITTLTLKETYRMPPEVLLVLCRLGVVELDGFWFWDHLFIDVFSRKVDLKVKLIILRVFFPEKSTLDMKNW